MTNKQISTILANANKLGKFESNSPEWHELRNQPGVISGSEIGAILGLSPFKSAYTLWAEKCKLVDDGFEQSIPMRLGQLVEPAIRQLYCEQHADHVVEEVGTYSHKEHTWAHANPDAICVDATGAGYVLEIKHTAVYWDAIPEHYKAQAYWYMWVFGLRKTVFAVVNAGRYKEYELVWDEFEWLVILQQVERFRQLVLDVVAPDWDGSDSTFETVRSLSPDVEDTKTELGQLGIELFNANLKVKEAEKHLTEMKSRTIDALQGSKYGTIEGQIVCTLSQRGAGKPFLTIKEQK